MSRRPALFTTVVLMACGAGGGDDVTRGPVEVSAYSYLTSPPGAPEFGAIVVFADHDGRSRTAFIDETGHASGEIEPGGSVWVGRAEDPFGQGRQFAAYLDVQPGASLVFGPIPPPVRAEPVRMSYTNMPPPVGASGRVRLYSRCGRYDVLDAVEYMVFDDRCAGTADVMAVAYTQSSSSPDRMTAYAYLPAITLVDGGAITIPPEAWRGPDKVTLDVLGLTELGGEASVLVTNAWNVATSMADVARAGDVFTANVPLIGDTLWVRVI